MAAQASSPRIAIIGAGLSGLCMAIKLREAGFSDFTLYEKAETVGGTWRDNRYPGVACDVPSHLYSYSFAPKADWTKVFSPGAEIQTYIEAVTKKYNLAPHIRFGSELKSARFDAGWQLEFADGQKATADFLIGAMGGLHIPATPAFDGAEDFQGTSFHTARWRTDHDLTGKRVAVIGTAASALQLIPEIVDKVAHLDIYQRTPNWVLPRPDRAYGDTAKARFARFPFLEKLHRFRIYCLFEMRFPLFRRNGFFARRSEQMALKHLEAQVADPDLRARLTPDYPVGCKRILASDAYFPALQHPNADLITEGISHVTADGIVCTSGTLRPVDTIIYATGFKPFAMNDGVSIQGRGGQTMADFFAHGGIRAHKTVSYPGFPNYFSLLGPNSGLGHNSIILIIEAQVKYVLQAIHAARQAGAKTLEPKAEAMAAFDQAIQADLKDTVWAGHCKSWYQGADGRIYTLWPRGTVSFRKALRRFDRENYLFR
ncbi:MAG: NAD(P)/FAD-dependent oxidoreductase [Alphaproteobacteria bacterium]|nr:MAG: NAD(P)/FAD-dependent oxidoreductase [Alphaproteobacteria bacterium]